MISIIICSRNERLDPKLVSNINSTIGVPFEIIAVDNSANNLTIFEAYNNGISKSSGSILCFMHDDVLYHTQNWGDKVYTYFENERTGAIGIAGSPYVPQMLGSWWGGNLVNQQLLDTKSENPTLQTKSVSGNIQDKSEVMVLDGVWICIKKSLFETICFDNSTFNDYHFYDIDICLQIHQMNFKIFVVYDILIEHLSSGKLNSQWIINANKFNEKWKRKLPLASVSLSYNNRCQAEFKTLNEYVMILLANKFSRKKAYRLAIAQTLRFYKGFFFYKTPYYLFKYLRGMLSNSPS